MTRQPGNSTRLCRYLAQGARALWTDERGQSTTEYILILSVVVMIAMKFKQTFQTKLINAVNTVGGEIDQAVQTDSSP